MFEKRGKAHRYNAYICKNLGYLNWFIWNFSSFLYYTILQIVPLSSHSEIFTLHVLFFWTLGKKFLHRYSHPLVNAVSYSARIRITWFFDRVLKNLQCYFIVLEFPRYAIFFYNFFVYTMTSIWWILLNAVFQLPRIEGWL